jgi:hypothetical protein
VDYVLVKFDDNWADEFDLEGFMIWEKEEWEQHKALALRCKNWPQESYFGTNEWTEWQSAKQYLDCFTEVDLSPEEVLTMTKLFGDRMMNGYSNFGIFEYIDDIEYLVFGDFGAEGRGSCPSCGYKYIHYLKSNGETEDLFTCDKCGTIISKHYAR